MPTLSDIRLNRIAQATKQDVARWAEGASLEQDSGVSVQALLCCAAIDRWKLAYAFRTQANKLYSAENPQYRSAISRYYYSMYHAMRACVFIEKQGDDHEKHSELPLHVPVTLDPTVNWAAKLKDARLLRNRVDYEAYPKPNKGWESNAHQIKQDAALLLKVSRSFLISKGCTI